MGKSTHIALLDLDRMLVPMKSTAKKRNHIHFSLLDYSKLEEHLQSTVQTLESIMTYYSRKIFPLVYKEVVILWNFNCCIKRKSKNAASSWAAQLEVLKDEFDEKLEVAIAIDVG